MSDLISLPCPSLQILDKTQVRVFAISVFFYQIPYIDMKLEAVTKLGKRNADKHSYEFKKSKHRSLLKIYLINRFVTYIFLEIYSVL